jgi:hypothetical protein
MTGAGGTIGIITNRPIRRPLWVTGHALQKRTEQAAAEKIFLWKGWGERYRLFR